jgi:hypothetical protein
MDTEYYTITLRQDFILLAWPFNSNNAFSQRCIARQSNLNMNFDRFNKEKNGADSLNNYYLFRIEIKL